MHGNNLRFAGRRRCRLRRLGTGRIQQMAMLQPVSPVERIHALFLTGGGVLALPRPQACCAIAKSERLDSTGHLNLRIPIVVSAVIDDSSRSGTTSIRPDADAAYKACTAASTAQVAEGNVGAGAGATVGKMHRGRGLGGMKGGIGSASLKLGDVVIGALAVVNAAGDVLDPRTGSILAGARRTDGSFADSASVMREIVSAQPAKGPALEDDALRIMMLGVVATNVVFNKTALTKIAMMANCGASRAVRPYHTTGDGDQMYAISTGSLVRSDIPLTAIGSLAADVIAEAIARAVRAASSIPDWPGLRDAQRR